MNGSSRGRMLLTLVLAALVGTSLLAIPSLAPRQNDTSPQAATQDSDALRDQSPGMSTLSAQSAQVESTPAQTAGSPSRQALDLAIPFVILFLAAVVSLATNRWAKKRIKDSWSYPA